MVVKSSVLILSLAWLAKIKLVFFWRVNAKILNDTITITKKGVLTLSFLLFHWRMHTNTRFYMTRPAFAENKSDSKNWIWLVWGWTHPLMNEFRELVLRGQTNQRRLISLELLHLNILLSHLEQIPLLERPGALPKPRRSCHGTHITQIALSE